MTDELPTEEDAKEGLGQPDPEDAESPSINLEQTHDVLPSRDVQRPELGAGNQDRRDTDRDKLAAAMDRLAGVIDRLDLQLEQLQRANPAGPGTAPEGLQGPPTPAPANPLQAVLAQPVASPAPTPGHPEMVQRTPEDPRREPVAPIQVNPMPDPHGGPKFVPPIIDPDQPSWLDQKAAEMQAAPPPDPAPTPRERQQIRIKEFKERKAEFQRTGINLRKRRGLEKRGYKIDAPQAPKEPLEKVGDGLKEIKQEEGKIEKQVAGIPKPEQEAAPNNDGVAGILQAILEAILSKPATVTQPAAPMIPQQQPAAAPLKGKKLPGMGVQIPKGKLKPQAPPKPKPMALKWGPDGPGLPPAPVGKPDADQAKGDVPPISDAAREMASSVQDHATEVNRALSETVQVLGDVARMASDALAAARAAGEQASRIGQAVQEMASMDNSRIAAQRSGSA